MKELLEEDKKYIKLRDRILDLTNSFDGDGKFYIDWCHVSPNGNKLIASKILEEIRKNKIKKE